MTMRRKKNIFSRDEFDRQIEWAIKHNIGEFWFTYIANSETDPSVYKIGISRNPLKREKTYSGGYRRFHFKMRYFLAGNIEADLLRAIDFAGAKSPLPQSLSSKPREAFFLDKKDVEYIVEKCGFNPISELILTNYQ